jgi:hypothetical protein
MTRKPQPIYYASVQNLDGAKMTLGEITYFFQAFSSAIHIIKDLSLLQVTSEVEEPFASYLRNDFEERFKSLPEIRP